MSPELIEELRAKVNSNLPFHMDAEQVKEVYAAVKPDEPIVMPSTVPVENVPEVSVPEEAGPKQGKLPDDFPGRIALGEANINTFAQARKQRDSKEGLTGVSGIGAATAAKIEEEL